MQLRKVGEREGVPSHQRMMEGIFFSRLQVFTAILSFITSTSLFFKVFPQISLKNSAISVHKVMLNKIYQ